MNRSYSSKNPFTVADAPSDVRAAFIRRTYGHLALAILAFILIEFLLLSWSGAGQLVAKMTNGYNWLIVLGAFMGTSWLADRWALSSQPRATSNTRLSDSSSPPKPSFSFPSFISRLTTARLT